MDEKLAKENSDQQNLNYKEELFSDNESSSEENESTEEKEYAGLIFFWQYEQNTRGSDNERTLLRCQ